MRKFYTVIASCIAARLNCEKSGNTEWHGRHTEKAESVTKQHAPSGSGVDRGTVLDLEKSTGDKLVFRVDFHHMDGHGFYDGWTDHEVIVTPAFDGVRVRVTGRDKRGIKDYIASMFYELAYVDVTE